MSTLDLSSSVSNVTVTLCMLLPDALLINLVAVTFRPRFSCIERRTSSSETVDMTPVTTMLFLLSLSLSAAEIGRR